MVRSLMMSDDCLSVRIDDNSQFITDNEITVIRPSRRKRDSHTLTPSLTQGPSRNYCTTIRLSILFGSRRPNTCISSSSTKSTSFLYMQHLNHRPITNHLFTSCTPPLCTPSPESYLAYSATTVVVIATV